jgi:hypothetical protein
LWVTARNTIQPIAYNYLLHGAESFLRS